MDFKSTNNLLTWIVTSDNIKNKDNKHVFAYQKNNNNTHSETFDSFIKETNLDLENTWYFDTALELAKMGNMIFCNIPDSNELLIFCPDLKDITKTQKIFLSLIQNSLQTFENITIALYNQEEDDFSDQTINGIDINQKTDILVKKLKNNR